MRHPERRHNAKLKAVLLTALTLCGVFLFPNAALATPEEELKKLRQELSSSNARQEEISARLKLLSGEIRALKEKSVAAAARLQKTEQNMVETETRLEDIAEVERQTLAALSKQNEDLADTLSALLQLGRQPEGSLIGSPDSLLDTLRAATLLQAAIPTLKKEAGELSGQLDALFTLRDQYLAEQLKYTDLLESRKGEQNALEELLTSKRDAQAVLANINARERRTQSRLNAEAKDLVALLRRLEQEKQIRLAEEKRQIEAEIARQQKLQAEEAKRQREEKARKLAEAKKNQENSIPTPSPSRKNEVEITQESQKTEIASLPPQTGRLSFAAKKGTLPLPVSGRIVSSYGNKKRNTQQNGIVIQSREGATVISPYDGQIAFAGPFRHYGLLLIIDHGEGYHTLLAGMGSIDGEVGQLLLAGEPVGRMNNGKDGKPTLYMELRAKGSPVNPKPWLAAGKRKVSG
ncbi:peptidoglycan DD-metalloendopeptidase family protein [Sneathiella sp. P13V-1]|uniref:murein hydrolase activator EnvC family protein n=1 Tax=Sneathiella sp. P13V-1 TaxID=2697366 RepID=UPI00187B2DE7|nr:peptidoglycan DD-metalloendopeptidase family protein [Sneathiella sp. P13V-1]MBE7636349.1 peptidoglycan DD-metalloendopeptidase family protein [Sneathiella sp. P13V-1]